jgi:choline dehydrogenase-like flavoprotein
MQTAEDQADTGQNVVTMEEKKRLHDTVNVTLEYSADLFDESQVLNAPSSDPVICAQRDSLQNEECQIQMQDLATSIRNEFLKVKGGCAPRLSGAGFGVVAHEVGTMRMNGPRAEGKYVVEDTYCLKDCNNIYVCDLSIFPVSPPANPSLTLAAMAMQLAKDLVEEE